VPGEMTSALSTFRDKLVGPVRVAPRTVQSKTGNLELMEHRVDRVRIQVRHTLVEIPWHSSRELVAHLLSAGPAAQRIAEKFQAVGVSRPVWLEPADEAVLIAVIERWGHKTGWEQVPDGISALLATLRGYTGLD
jgi:hypothetical protein